MKRCSLWIITLICLICLLVTGTGNAEGAPEAQGLELNQYTVLSVEAGEEALVCFTADTTGLYSFSASTSSSVKSIRYAEENGELHALFSRTLANEQESLVLPLRAGETGYFGVRFENEGVIGSFQVKMSRLGALGTVNPEGQTVADVTAGSLTYFAFTLEESGAYDFYSAANADTVAYCYTLNNGLFAETGYDDDSGENANFSLRVAANAGETVYLGVRFYSGDQTGSFPFRFEKYEGLAVTYVSEQEISQVYGTSTVMKVEALSQQGEVTWTWLRKEDGLYAPIGGASGNSYTVPADLKETTEYRCVVSDGTTVFSYEFHVEPMEELENVHAKDDQEYFEILPNESVDLEVEASSISGLHTYQWYEQKLYETNVTTGYYLEPIPDAVHAMYHVEGIRHGTDYVCRVTSGFGDSVDIWFYVDVICELAVEADGDTTVTVPAGGSADLKVLAETESNLVTYQWYKQLDGYWQPVEGAVTDTLHIENIQRYSEYYCHVEDGYGNQEEIGFSVYIEDDVQAYASNAAAEAEYGEDCTLSVVVSPDDGGYEFSYQWYGPAEAEGAEADAINGETGSELVLTDVRENGYYYCLVRDQYDFRERVDFSVRVANELTVDYVSWIDIQAGSIPTLSVDAECRNGELSYQWYGPIADGQPEESAPMIEGETGFTHRVEQWNSGHDVYFCTVRDIYGNTETCRYDVIIHSDMTADYGCDSDITAGYGETVTLSVNASSALPITYQWYKYDAVNPYLDGWKKLEEETADTLTIAPVSESGNYRCDVSDPTGEYQWFGFYIEFNNELQASCAEQYFSIKANETVTLAVSASCRGGEISYQWYAETHDNYGNSAYRALEGETRPQAVISDHEFNDRRFYCIVSDEAGNTVECGNFEIWVDNGFSANAVNSYRTTTPFASETLTVQTTSYDGKLTYEWYINDEYIADAGDASYVVDPVSSHVEARCHVHDRFGGEADLYFTISVENHLTASPVEETQEVRPETTAEMEVTASWDAGEITYQWYEAEGYYDEYGNWYDAKLIDGADGPVCTSKVITELARYYCQVRDQFGNETNVDFYININNHLSAEAVQRNLTVTPTETATMEVTASCDVGNITYQWYKDGYWDEDGSWHAEELIGGATETSYTSEPVVRYTSYHCDAYDQYGASSTVYFNISIENHLTAKAVQESFSVIPQSTVEMAVEADCSVGELSYKWYKNGYWDDNGSWHDTEEIEGAAGASCTSEPAVRYTYYYCRVEDEYGNSAAVDFYINIENHLTAKAVQGNFAVAPESTVEMAVEADCSVGELSYEWYKNGYWDDNGSWHDTEEIEGAAGASYTSEPVVRHTSYYCRIRDQYGNSTTVSFYIDIENHLTAKAVQESFSVAPQSTVEMAVEADCSVGELSYEWYKNGYWDDNGSWHDTEEIEGAVGASCTSEPVVRHTSYYCRIRDQYGNSTTVSFYIDIENHLTAKAVQESFSVEPQSTVEMAVEADCSVGELSYQWYKNGYWDEEGSWHSDVKIEGATGTSCISKPLTRYTNYYCIVRDQYGNEEDVWFSISIENHFSAEAVESELYVAPNGTASMAVSARCDIGNITYQWYKEEVRHNEDGTYSYTTTIVDGATEASWTSEPVAAYTRYYCYVRDEFGSADEVWFFLHIENHFSAEAVQDDFAVAPNETVTMEVHASCDVGILSYEWYRDGYYDGNGSWHDRERITGAGNADYTAGPVTGRASYSCYVQDQYENTAEIHFHISIENNLHAWPEGASQGTNSKDLRVNYGDTVNLKVNVTANDTTGITYQWYRNELNAETGAWSGYQAIEGENTDSVTVENAATRTEYEFRVQDMYGNERYVYFYIRIDNHLRVTIEGEQEDTKDIFTAPGAAISMKAGVSADNTDGLVYWWEKNGTQIAGENGTELAVTADAGARYRFRARDIYGNEGSAEFSVFTVPDLSTLLQLVPNETASASITNVIAFYRFIPEETAEYSLYSKIDQDTYGYLLDENMQKLTRDDDSGDNNNFRIDYELEAGKTYIYGVRFYDMRKTGTISLYLEQHFDNHLRAWPDGESEDMNNSNLTAAPGETIDLKVNVAADDTTGITYRWFREVYDAETGSWTDNAEIEGETANTITVKNISVKTNYTCLVQDQYGNEQYVYFRISLESDFQAWVDDETGSENTYKQIELDPEETEPLTLKVRVTGAGAESVSYQWYRSCYNMAQDSWETETMEGEIQPVIVIDDFSVSANYYCRVWNLNGDSQEVRFYIVIQNYLRMEVDGALNGNNTKDFFVDPGETIHLKVRVFADNETGLKYWWEKDSRRIDGADGTEMTITAENNIRYRCWVMDTYNNRYNADFRVFIRPNVSALPELVPDQPTEALVADKIVFCRFTPEETAEYTLYSTVSRDTYVYLLDENMQILANDDDGGEQNNFLLTHVLKAGKTYVYGVRFFDTEVTGSIELHLVKTGEALGAPAVTIEDIGITEGQDLRITWTEITEAEEYEVSVWRADGTQVITTRTADTYMTIDACYLTPGEYGISVSSLAAYRAPGESEAETILVAETDNVLTIPAGITEIDEEAFCGIESVKVIVPVSCETIGPRAFADCPNLYCIVISGAGTEVSPDAFEGGMQKIIRVVPGSRTEEELQDYYRIEYLE